MLKYMYMNYSNNSLVRIYTTHQDSIPKMSAQKYLDQLCQKQGSSLIARRNYYQEKMNIYKFIPIVVSKEEIYFPISNIKNYDCIWVNYFAIQKIVYIKKECIITFMDNTSLVSSYGMRIKKTMFSIQRYLHSSF